MVPTFVLMVSGPLAHRRFTKHHNAPENTFRVLTLPGCLFLSQFNQGQYKAELQGGKIVRLAFLRVDF